MKRNLTIINNLFFLLVFVLVSAGTIHTAIGGNMFQAYGLKQADLEPSGSRLQAQGLPHENTAAALAADAGLMRSGLLEPLTMRDIWHSKRLEMLLALTALLIIVLLSMLLFAYTRRLSKTLKVLRENEEDLRISAVAFDTHDAMFITDIDEKIIRVNNAFVLLTGYRSKEVIGMT